MAYVKADWEREGRLMKQTRKQRKEGRPKKLRQNPAFSVKSPFDSYLKNIMGNAMVQTALLGCTFEEKTIVATFIPLMLKFIRTVPHKNLDPSLLLKY